MHDYLKHFAAVRNARASAALGDLALVTPCCRIDQYSLSFLSASVRLWNSLPSTVFVGDTLNSFKSAMNLCLLKA